MAPVTLEIDSNYGYVLGTATLTGLVGVWHMFHTAKYRKRAKIPYPNAYASATEVATNTDAYLFNCAQRSHATFLEHQTITVLSLLISGLKFPLAASACGVLWCAGRLVYAKGYVDEKKERGKGRMRGNFAYFGELGVLGMAGYVAVGLVMGW